MIWLKGKCLVPPLVTYEHGEPIIRGGVWEYKWWQKLLNKAWPSMFPTIGLHMSDQVRVCGWTVEEIVDLYGPIRQFPYVN